MTRKTTDIPPSVIDELTRGVRETSTLVECFVIDFAVLMGEAVPDCPAPIIQRMRKGASLPYTKRMRLASELCIEAAGVDRAIGLLEHPSDTVRGWACYAMGLAPGLTVQERIEEAKPASVDPHFGVREWAWLGIRESIVADPVGAINHLEPWVHEPDPFLRRYASEATRPRGVWAKHITELRERPELGIPLLEPLRSDPDRYVQDSVANWLNDASKDRPDWVRRTCAAWLAESDGIDTARICKRAQRSLGR